MEEIKKKLENAKDKMVGQGKETVGKVFGNHEMELKGKIQSVKSDVMENMEEGIHDIKQGVSKKINHAIDKFENKKS